jgi:hypothetical protein
MVLLWPLDPSDPVTCVTVLENNVVLIGTGLGGVKLLYRPALDQPFNSIALANRSQEFIVDIVVEDGDALAVVGDVGIKRWDLGALSYATPLIMGCRYDEVAFIMSHSTGLCPSSLTLVAPRMSEQGPRVLVARVNGDCCFTDMAARTQFERNNIGPMSSSDTSVALCAFDGKTAIWLERDSDYVSRLKAWSVWEAWKEIPLKVTWTDRLGDFRGARFLNEDSLLLLLGTALQVCRIKDNALVPVRTKDHVFLFGLLHVGEASYVVYLSRGGRVCLAEMVDWRTTSSIELRSLAPTRELKSRAQFLLNVPYFVRAHRSAVTGMVSVVFSDDTGVQIEENLFKL